MSDNDAQTGAAETPVTITSDVSFPPVGFEMRNYFSTYFLRAAREFARSAQAVEDAHAGDSVFDIDHCGLVLGSVISSASFLEAMITPQRSPPGMHGSLSELDAAGVAQMAKWWKKKNQGWTSPLKKFEQLVRIAGRSPLDKDAEPHQSAALLFELRNALVHYRSETVAAHRAHGFDVLKDRFPSDRLMAGAGNPWWPDHALGAGCARWAHASAEALADFVVDETKVNPNHKAHETTWFSK